VATSVSELLYPCYFTLPLSDCRRTQSILTQYRCAAGVRGRFADRTHNGATLRTGAQLAVDGIRRQAPVAKRRRGEHLPAVRLEDGHQEDHEFSMSSTLGDAPSRSRPGRTLLHDGRYRGVGDGACRCLLVIRWRIQNFEKGRLIKGLGTKPPVGSMTVRVGVKVPAKRDLGWSPMD